MKTRNAALWQTWLILEATAAVVISLHWNGLQNYLLQTHPEIELPAAPSSVLDLSGSFQGFTELWRGKLANGMEESNQVFLATARQTFFPPAQAAAPPLPSPAPLPTPPAESQAAPQDTVAEPPQPPIAVTATAKSVEKSAAVQELTPPTETALAGVVLPEDKFLFIGDSLMQGVAPHLRRALCGKQRAQCRDLSKPSTGLSQKYFFDWPAAVTRTLQQEKHSVVFVFLGANDPWDFTDGKQKIRFRSAAWRSAYGTRVQEILDAARSSGAIVVWLGLPNMRPPRLNEGQGVQNQIFAEKLQASGGLFVETHGVVDDGGLAFKPAIRRADGREITMRLEDGVHFTIAGQRRIADAALARFVASRAAPPRPTTPATPAEIPPAAPPTEEPRRAD